MQGVQIYIYNFTIQISTRLAITLNYWWYGSQLSNTIPKQEDLRMQY